MAVPYFRFGFFVKTGLFEFTIHQLQLATIKSWHTFSDHFWDENFWKKTILRTQILFCPKNRVSKMCKNHLLSEFSKRGQYLPNLPVGSLFTPNLKKVIFLETNLKFGVKKSGILKTWLKGILNPYFHFGVILKTVKTGFWDFGSLAARKLFHFGMWNHDILDPKSPAS